MLIDWFTVGAQTLNFLILVWLMKRFLYRPILQAIDAREQHIAAELADADSTREQARTEREAFRHRNEAFDEERAALMRSATEEVRIERQRLLDGARTAADDLSAQRDTLQRSEARDLHQELRHRTQQEVFAIARKALADLATESLEASVVELFIRRLDAMQSADKARLGEALRTASETARLRSAFELSEAQRTALRDALNAAFSTEREVSFERAPDLVAGIELSANGQRLSWNIADYVATLERGVDEVLAKRGKALTGNVQPETANA